MKTAIKIADGLLFLGIILLACHLGSDDATSREPFREDASHEFVRGDANGDQKLNIVDPVALLTWLFLDGDKPSCLAAADADDDGILELADAVHVLRFLFVGDAPPAEPFPDAGLDPTPDLGCREPPLPPLPPVNSLGGPDRELSDAEAVSWRRGRQLFDRATSITQGLGPLFNGDSCRGCHLDPVIGGSGGIDVDVVRFAHVNPDDVVSPMEGGPASSRHSILATRREEVPAAANVIETRQPPTILGLGLVDRVPDAALLQNADPDDLDGDGISGRARMVGDRVGRFNHKAGAPTLRDFAADALQNELGLTIDPALSPFGGASDGDDVADPELGEQEFLDLAFFLAHLAPPPRRIPEDPGQRARVDDGEQLFLVLGCAGCHTPELAGADGPVRAYSDFLLHGVAHPDRHHVFEPGVDPREFRTPPLWGLRDTGPYLHDGSAESIHDAIMRGHHGEARAAREAYEVISLDQKRRVVEFLESL